MVLAIDQVRAQATEKRLLDQILKTKAANDALQNHG